MAGFVPSAVRMDMRWLVVGALVLAAAAVLALLAADGLALVLTAAVVLWLLWRMLRH